VIFPGRPPVSSTFVVFQQRAMILPNTLTCRTKANEKSKYTARARRGWPEAEDVVNPHGREARWKTMRGAWGVEGRKQKR